MGLFGGFKAKLLGKEKRNKQTNDAVCVKFKVFSEFDSPENLDIRPGKSNVVKSRKIPQKTNIKNVFNGQSSSTENTEVTEVNQTITNTENKLITGIKNKKKTAPKIPTQPNDRKIVNNSQIERQRNEKQQNEKQTKQQNEKQTKEQNEKQIKQQNEKQTKQQNEKQIKQQNEKQTKQQNEKQIKQQNEKQTKQQDSQDQRYKEKNQSHHKQEETNDENFPIHIVNQTHANNFYSNFNSEDEISDDENHYLYSNASTINYSSQASNIFFGGGDEPEVIRPRKIIINDDTLSEGSSASA